MYIKAQKATKSNIQEKETRTGFLHGFFLYVVLMIGRQQSGMGLQNAGHARDAVEHAAIAHAEASRTRHFEDLYDAGLFFRQGKADGPVSGSNDLTIHVHTLCGHSCCFPTHSIHLSPFRFRSHLYCMLTKHYILYHQIQYTTNPNMCQQRQTYILSLSTVFMILYASAECF